MKIKSYCRACKCDEQLCLVPGSHRAQGKVVYAVDFLLGGRPPKGTRIRHMFKAGITKDEAKKWAYSQITDFERGQLHPKDNSKMLFKEALKRYYDEHLLPNSHSRLPNILYYQRQLEKYLGHIPLGVLSLQILESARTKFKEESDSSNGNVNRLFSVCKTVLNRCVEWNYLTISPARFLRNLPTTEPIPRFLTVEEIARLRAHIHDWRLNDYVSVLLHTGIRPIDIKGMEWGQVDLQNRVVHVTTYKGRRPHTYSVPIDEALFPTFERRFKETQGRGKVFDTSNVRKLAEKAIQDSGINEGRKESELFTIYGLKHCYASHLLMSGATIFDVAKLLGHTDTTMIMRHYGFLTGEHLREVQGRMNLTPTQPKFEVL